MTELQRAHDRLVDSPQLLKAWHTAGQKETAYAWHLLNLSGVIPPEIPQEFIPYHPRVRIWENSPSVPDNKSFTLTVFAGVESQCRCRHAIWDAGDGHRQRDRLVDFVNRQGDVPFVEPTFLIRDAEVPYDRLRVHLQAIAACQVPAVSWQNPEDGSVTCSAGWRGFAYFSPSQPPASLQFQWSTMDDHPQSWNPVIEQVGQLQAFLLGCFY